MATTFIASKIQHLQNLSSWIPQAETLDTIDSPFLYEWTKEVVWRTPANNILDVIEKRRNKFLNDNTKIEIEDFGSGTFLELDKTRSVSQIAKSAVSNPKKSILLYNLIKYLNPASVLELGTSLGISTLYMAAAAIDSPITTLEGSLPLIGMAANHNYEWAKNIEYINGTFTQSLNHLITQERKYDVIYIDGGHASSIQIPLTPYYNGLSTEHSCWIVDDIYWSCDMTEWWNQLKQDKRWNVSIDLYHFGVLMFNANLKEKIDIKVLPNKIRWKPGVARP